MRCYLLNKVVCASLFLLAPGAVAATTAAAEATAPVILLGENEVTLGRVVKIAGLERLGRKSGEARVSSRHSKKKVLAARLVAAEALKGSCSVARLLGGSFRQSSACCAFRYY